VRDLNEVDGVKVEKLVPVFTAVEEALGKWIGYEWESPPSDWWETRKTIGAKAKL
jgi:hypothetical protein